MKRSGVICWPPAICALVVIAGLYFISQPPKLSEEDRQRLAEQFQFDRHELPKISKKQPQSIRSVHPDLQHLVAWISFVGAAVSLGDLDGDGYPNDLIYVDPRFDEITVCPVPGTGDRYPAFLLSQQELYYEESTSAPMGTLIGDFNEDGCTDVMAYFWGRSPIIYLQKQNGNAASTKSDALCLGDFVPQELVSPSQVWHTSTASQADLDGDGHLDLVIGNYNPDDAETLNSNSTSSEVMMANWARADNGGTNRLMLWEPASDDGFRFHDVEGVLDESVARGWTFAIGLADLDDDLLPEIYFVQDFGPDQLLHNRSTPGNLKFELLEGRRTLSMPRSKVIGQDTFNGMGIDFADLNEDGLMDMMVSNITSDYGFHESNFVFLNSGNRNDFQNGIAPFLDGSEALGLSRGGWTWGTKFADFDNDSYVEVMQATGFIKGETDRWPEMHEMALANEELARFSLVYPSLVEGDDVSGHEHNPLFVRNGERYFDIAPELSSSFLDEPMLSRGIATGDVDGDGKMDFALANHWEDSYFFHNAATPNNQFLGLNLRIPLETEGEESEIKVSLGHPDSTIASRPAVGAQVIVQFNDGTPRKLIGQVDGGNGHSGQCAPGLHFGLGELAPETGIAVHLRWRDRAGMKREHVISQIRPGWHTVYLYSGNEK